jgi:hypothetical protein
MKKLIPTTNKPHAKMAVLKICLQASERMNPTVLPRRALQQTLSFGGSREVEPGRGGVFPTNEGVLRNETIADGGEDVGIDALAVGSSVADFLLECSRRRNRVFADVGAAVL